MVTRDRTQRSCQGIPDFCQPVEAAVDEPKNRRPDQKQDGDDKYDNREGASG
jgi:hypothetical protein